MQKTHSLQDRRNAKTKRILICQPLKIWRTLALVLLMAPVPAMADVTNAGVWDNLQGFLKSAGYTISATSSAQSDVLEITDLTLVKRIGTSSAADTETAKVTLPNLTFNEQSDGTVTITMPRLGTLALNFIQDTGEKVDAGFRYSQNGLKVIVTGDERPGAQNPFDYDYTIAGLNFQLEQFMINGKAYGSEVAAVNFGLTDVSGQASLTAGTHQFYQQKSRSAFLNYDLVFAQVEDGDLIKIKGVLSDLNSKSEGTIPSADFFTELSMDNISGMLDAGLEATGAFTYSKGSMDIAYEGNNGSGAGTSSTTGGAFEYSFGSDGVVYNARQTGLAITATLPDLPLPLVFNMAFSAYNIAIPMQESPEDQDFAFGITLSDFKFSDVVWLMLDPGGKLSHDPATFDIDLSGKVKVLIDFLDLDQMAVLEENGGIPGELNALSVKKLVLDAVGARLSGSGDFTFDNTDQLSFNGLPQPQGTFNLVFDGGNALLDNLIAMGLIPAGQAEGFRIMARQFNLQSTDQDRLEFKFEVKPAGEIMVNGQRIQ